MARNGQRRRKTLALAISGALALGLAQNAAAGFPAIVQLSALDGTTGFKLDGEALFDNSGIRVSAAGDINGDGIDDLIIGAFIADPNGNYSGRSYVVFGKTGGFTSPLQLSSLDGTDGFKLDGEGEGDRSGRSVSAAGDINGDGVDDLIVGAWASDSNGSDSGRSYVVFGKTGGFTSPLQLSSLDGTSGFKLDGEAAGHRSGGSVSAAGDINGDGIDDLIIGASNPYPNGIDTGRSYVVFGKTGGFTSPLQLSSLDGTDGFKLNGETADDRSGYSVSAAGDINGDGVDDLIVGAWAYYSNGFRSGRSYLVFGKTGGFTSPLQLSSLDGTSGFKLDGEAAGDRSGRWLSNAGDINGDGIDDLIVGAYHAAPNGVRSGRSYVVFGKTGGFTSPLQLSSLDGTDGFKLDGEAPRDYSGILVSAAGDINGDGIDDLIIGAHGADFNGDFSGRSYVVFGKTGGFTSPLQLSSLDGTSGFKLDGEAAGDRSGRWLSNAGDINGDGIDDLIIGAYRADPNGLVSSGRSYVVFGGPPVTPAVGLTPADLAFGNVMLGQTSAPQAVTLENTGSADLVLGALALSGANPGDFALGSDTCSSQTVVPAATCTFDVTLTPSATGPRAAQVDIPSNAPTNPDTVPLSGTGESVNDPPVARDDNVATDEDTILNGNVLVDNGNGADSDVDGDVLAVTEVNGVAVDVDTQITLDSGALLTVNSDGSFDYDPNGQFERLGAGGSGIESFDYTISDGQATDSATVTVAINGVDDPPVAANDTATISEDAPASAIDVLANDTDIDGGPIAIDSVTQPAGGTVNITGGGSALTYQPDPDVCNDGSPTDDFSYTLTPGGSSATVAVTVTCVNDAPAANAGTATTDEDSAVTITLTGSDVDGDALTFAIATAPANGSLGAVTPINDTTAEVTYTPVADFNGSDSFTFTVNDGTVESGAATVDITVDAVNDPPEVNDDTATTDEDTPVDIGVLANDTDIDGNLDPATVTVTSGPADGATSVNTTTGVVTYTPDADFSGNDAFTYEVCDDGTPTPSECASATVSITVDAVNDAPEADVGTTTTDEDSPVTITLTGSDVDGDALTFAIATAPANGSLDAITPINDTTAEVTYTPDADFNGNDSFNYQVCDSEPLCDTATVSITVNAVNDPPTFTAGGDVETFEGTAFDAPWASDISPGPADEAGQSVLFVITGNTNPGLFDVEPALDSSGQLTFTPAPDTTGSAEITAVAADDGGTANGGNDISDPTTFTVDVIAVADLALRKRDCADPNRPGGQVTYLLQARNQGPADATAVMVDDSLPDGMTLVDSIPSGLCSDTGMGMLNCDLGALSAGAGLEFSIIAAIDASVMNTVLANVAVISGAESDPVAANNFGTEFTLILSDLIFADNMEKCTPD